MYIKLGFNIKHETEINYWYVKGIQRYHKSNFQKKSIIHLFEDKTKTEEQMMKELGYNRIWDCGLIKFDKII